MSETPAIKIKPPKVGKGNPYPMFMVSMLVQDKFEALSSEAQEEILSLTSYDLATEGETGLLINIFRNNAYNTGDHVGLFPKIARINHSCRPNTSYYWSEQLNKRIVYATRKINKGEEFSVSYISLLLPRHERQKHLDRYGFKCQCEACAQKQAAIEASDNHRITISNAFTEFERHISLTPPQSKVAKQQAQYNAKVSLQLAELLHQEGLADYYAKAYKMVAINHARVEDWPTSAIWANKAYELRVLEDPQSPSTMEMYQLTSLFIQNWEAEVRNLSKASI